MWSMNICSLMFGIWFHGSNVLDFDPSSLLRTWKHRRLHAHPHNFLFQHLCQFKIRSVGSAYRLGVGDFEPCLETSESIKIRFSCSCEVIDVFVFGFSFFPPFPKLKFVSLSFHDTVGIVPMQISVRILCFACCFESCVFLGFSKLGSIWQLVAVFSSMFVHVGSRFSDGIMECHSMRVSGYQYMTFLSGFCYFQIGIECLLQCICLSDWILTVRPSEKTLVMMQTIL